MRARGGQRLYLSRLSSRQRHIGPAAVFALAMKEINANILIIDTANTAAVTATNKLWYVM